MSDIAVIGDRDSVLGFRALGLEVHPVEDAAQARKELSALAKEGCSIVYLTEELAAQIPGEVERYKDLPSPAVILIPGRMGSLGIAAEALHNAVERAVGSDILQN